MGAVGSEPVGLRRVLESLIRLVEVLQKHISQVVRADYILAVSIHHLAPVFQFRRVIPCTVFKGAHEQVRRDLCLPISVFGSQQSNTFVTVKVPVTVNS